MTGKIIAEAVGGGRRLGLVAEAQPEPSGEVLRQILGGFELLGGIALLAVHGAQDTQFDEGLGRGSRLRFLGVGLLRLGVLGFGGDGRRTGFRRCRLVHLPCRGFRARGRRRRGGGLGGSNRNGGLGHRLRGRFALRLRSRLGLRFFFGNGFGSLGAIKFLQIGNGPIEAGGIVELEGSKPQGAQARHLNLGLGGRFQQVGGRGAQFLPELPFLQGLEQAAATVRGRRTGLVEGVVLGMARVGNQAAGERDGIGGAAELVVVAHQPLLVVGVVVDLIGQDKLAAHVGVIDPGAGLLLPDGIIEAFHLRVGVAGHVPHVGDGRRRLAAEGGGLQRTLGLAVVPEMDAVVMRRMVGGDGKDLVEQGVDRLRTGDRRVFFGMPDLPDQEGLRLDIVRPGLDDFLEVADEVELALLLVALVVLFQVKILHHPDPGTVAVAGLVLEGDRLAGELFGAGLVVDVGHGHAPEGHGAVLVEGGRLAERALGLVEPKAVELTDALVEEALGHRLGGLHREIYPARALDQHRRLAGALVEGLAVGGVTRQRVGGPGDGQDKQKQKKGAHGIRPTKRRYQPLPYAEPAF